MRTFIVIVATAATAAVGLMAIPPTAHAEEAAFCAMDGGRNGYQNCGYYTLNQCREAVSGVGGYCIPNPRFSRRSYDDGPPPPRRPRRID